MNSHLIYIKSYKKKSDDDRYYYCYDLSSGILYGINGKDISLKDYKTPVIYFLVFNLIFSFVTNYLQIKKEYRLHIFILTIIFTIIISLLKLKRNIDTSNKIRKNGQKYSIEINELKKLYDKGKTTRTNTYEFLCLFLFLSVYCCYEFFSKGSLILIGVPVFFYTLTDVFSKISPYDIYRLNRLFRENTIG